MGKPSSPSADAKAQTALAQQLAASGAASEAEGAKLFNLGLPGLEQSETYYSKLASGDPNALARANAPAVQSITQATNSAKGNIVQDQPKGGERNLALEEADLTKGAQIGSLETGSYTGSFGSLAGLGGQNVSQGNAATATGNQAFSGAANQYGQMQQIDAESKASTLGFVGSLAGAGAEAYGACWVAMELYGDNAYETHLIRAYLYDVVSRQRLGKYAVKVYEKYGQRWATFIKTHPFWRRLSLRVFNCLFRAAQDALPESRQREAMRTHWKELAWQ